MGLFQFLKREQLTQSCQEEDGSLVIERDVQIAAEIKRVWYPKELQQQDIWVELYRDASSATSDVAFSVGETTYQVHKNIISVRTKNIWYFQGKRQRRSDPNFFFERGDLQKRFRFCLQREDSRN